MNDMERFTKWAGEDTFTCGLNSYGMDAESLKQAVHLERLFDHGFVADRAPVWSKGVLNGNEIAIISRTYLSEEEIDNPGDGLKCWKLPKEAMGKNINGIWIATVITKATAAADAFVCACSGLSVYLLTYVISKEMAEEGKGVLLTVVESNQVNLEIVDSNKLERHLLKRLRAEESK